MQDPTKLDAFENYTTRPLRQRDFHGNEASFFFKDDWKLKSSLTLNAGLRWDYFGSFYESSGFMRRDNSVVVRVVDDGSGIPQNIRDRIFDPFFTTKPVGAGMGLGLDIVRRLVLRHNGHIDVNSKPGHTEFCVTLPVAQSR